MTKADLVEEVTQLGDLTRRERDDLETIFDSVIHALRTGDKIEIRVSELPHPPAQAQDRSNPKTGAKVDVPAKRVPYFKPSKELRDLVNPKERPQMRPSRTAQERTLGRVILVRPTTGDANHAHHPPGKPRSMRWEKKRSVWQPVHCPVIKMADSFTPAASNCRRFASARSRCIAGADRAMTRSAGSEKQHGYFFLIWSESYTSRNSSDA